MDIELSRREGLVAVKIIPRSAGSGKALSIRLPPDRILDLHAGQEAEFTVDPSRYYLAFGRSRNGAERASAISAILGGGPPATDPRRMTPAEAEAYICNLETAYVPTPK